MTVRPPFLRIPPFPGHRAAPLACANRGETFDNIRASQLVELLRKGRVGGSFWAAEPRLPDRSHIVLAPSFRQHADKMLAEAGNQGIVDRCIMLGPRSATFGRFRQEVPALPGPIDPWKLAETADQLWVSADHELALVAALAGRQCRIFSVGCDTDSRNGENGLADAVLREVGGWAYRNPFTGALIDALEAVEMLSEWRKLIDSNRQIAGVFGIAAWKRPTVDPLMWNGMEAPHHVRQATERLPTNGRAIVWRSRTSAHVLDQIEKSPMDLAEIEDGFVRGPGLGANCVPPLSIVVDNQGIYFDPSTPSDLEEILGSTDMDAKLIERAARLRERIVETGISKYGIAPDIQPAGGNNRRQILAVGQVEDDRSVLSGGAGQTNLELLCRVRQLESEAWIIYRPHPDVEAGHRKGHVPDEIVLSHADEIDRGSPVATLIEKVDGLHCITSLAGFEALLRGKAVTTHGVPFYAGWGLTTDLADIPARRSRKRTLDELVAATLILYPRYLDPVTRLPCPPEILVERMACGEAAVAAPLSGVRKLQGKLKLALRGFQRSAA